jgi:cell shape-determining protein MreC
MRKQFWVKYTVVLLVIITLNLLPFGDKINALLGYYGFASVYASEEIIRVSEQFFSFLGNYSQLEGKYVEIKEENIVLKAQIANYKIMEEELNRLYDELNVKEEQPEIIVAQVLRHNGSDSSDRIFINKGQKDGIKSGDSVFVGENLIGIAEEVNANYSVVKLPNSSSVNYSVLIIGSDGKSYEGLSFGGQNGVGVKNISQYAVINKGDIVMINDLRVKRYAVLGKIDRVLDDSTNNYKEAFVETFVNYKELKFVTVRL